MNWNVFTLENSSDAPRADTPAKKAGVPPLLSRGARVDPLAGVERTERGHGRRGDLPGVRKAAVLVLAVDENVATELMKRLDDADVELLTAEIARLGVVDRETLAVVLEEFGDLAELDCLIREGGMEQAIRFIEGSFPPARARRLKDLVESHRDVPFAFLSRAETEGLLAVLGREDPQTVAVVLAHMPASKAGELIKKTPPRERRDLVERIAEMRATPPEVIREIEGRLRRYSDTLLLAPSGARRGGVEAAAEILRAAGTTGSETLDELRKDRPGLAGEIDRRFFEFEDIDRFDDAGLRRVAQSIEPSELAVSLKTASSALQNRVIGVLPASEAEAIRGELSRLGPLRIVDVEEARAAVVQAAMRLESNGEFVSGEPARGKRKTKEISKRPQQTERERDRDTTRPFRRGGGHLKE